MLDLPRFAVVQYDTDLDCWQTLAVRPTFETARAEFRRYRSQGLEHVYVVGLAFVLAPADYPGAEE